LHYAGMHRFALTVVHCSEGLHDYGQVQEGDEAAELLAALDAREAGVLRSTADVIARHEGVEVEVRVATGRPADALARESLRADLVVVGSRGRGAFAGMLLGSVSAEVLQRARCPVAVIR
jgi:nucleotide-binding universal stress UspA family protein